MDFLLTIFSYIWKGFIVLIIVFMIFDKLFGKKNKNDEDDIDIPISIENEGVDVDEDDDFD